MLPKEIDEILANTTNWAQKWFQHMSQSHFQTPAGSDYLDGIVKGLHYEISLCQSDFGSEEFHLAYFTLYIWKDLEKNNQLNLLEKSFWLR